MVKESNGAPQETRHERAQRIASTRAVWVNDLDVAFDDSTQRGASVGGTGDDWAHIDGATTKGGSAL
ncbi:MAG: hypothetical protein FWD58_03705 [Firmicutes bacterium]|nr:hypothetical protein [Bacillota bacterium]